MAAFCIASVVCCTHAPGRLPHAHAAINMGRKAGSKNKKTIEKQKENAKAQDAAQAASNVANAAKAAERQHAAATFFSGHRDVDVAQAGMGGASAVGRIETRESEPDRTKQKVAPMQCCPNPGSGLIPD